jgi:hypothetical protein
MNARFFRRMPLEGFPQKRVFPVLITGKTGGGFFSRIEVE